MEEAVESFISLGEAPSSKKRRNAEFSFQREEGVYDLELSDDDDDDDDDDNEDTEDSDEEEDADIDMDDLGTKNSLHDGDDGDHDEEEEDGEDDDDDEEEDGEDDDDEEEEEEDDYGDETLMSSWGRKKDTYYAGDTADLEIGQDFEDAEDEEEAAKELRQRQLKQLSASEDAFFGDLLSQAPTEDGLNGAQKVVGAVEEQVEVQKLERSMESLPKKEKLQILMSRAPELLPLLDEASLRLRELKDVAVPLAKKVSRGKGGATEMGNSWVKLKREALFTYVLNVIFYLSLRCGEDGEELPDAAAIKEHPSVTALLRTRRLLESCGLLDQMLREQVKHVLRAPAPPPEPQIVAESKSVEANRGKKKNGRKRRRRATAADGKVVPEKPVEEIDFMQLMLQEKERQRKAKADKYAVKKRKRDEGLQVGEKRGATYQIMKNRGLTPHKSKMNRNPRVKKREQYRRALLRRKGQVRGMRTGEADSYGGELSGINAKVSRSRPLGTS